MSESEIVTEENAQKPKRELIPVSDSSEFAVLMDTGRFDQTWRVAKLFSCSDVVPGHYRQKPENCFIACNMAMRLGFDPLMLMQKTYIVSGKMGMEGQLAIALVNQRGPFKGPIKWKFEGEGPKRQCTAYALLEDGDLCEATVDWKMVAAEQWDKNPKWKSMTDQMFRYRSAVFLARSYCPEVLMGMSIVDELEDLEANRTIRTVNPEPGKPRSEVLANQIPDVPIEDDPTAEHPDTTQGGIADDYQDFTLDLINDMRNEGIAKDRAQAIQKITDWLCGPLEEMASDDIQRAREHFLEAAE